MSMKNLRRVVLMGSTAVLAAGMANATVAAQDDDEVVEEVVVTGSRIVRKDLNAPTPIQIVGTQDIQFGAETNIGDLINQLPSAGTPAFNRTNSAFSTANGGVTSVDLRNLGSSRTLILQNNRRFVAGVPGSSAVDLNMISSALVERVEVITGGASAVYGSDAIAGVVNFIMKDDYEGVEIGARQEFAEVKGGNETVIQAVVGGNFADDRGNATLSIQYTDQKALYSRDVERTAIDGLSSIYFGGDTFDETSPVHSSFPPQGRFFWGNGNWTFNPNGELYQGFNSAVDGFNRSAFRTIAIPTERMLISGSVNYDITENVKFFTEYAYARTETDVEIEPFPLSGDDIFPATLGIPISYLNENGDSVVNPYIPAELLAAAQADGSEYIGFVRRLAEFGPRQSFDTRQTFRIATGFQGTLFDKFNWDVSYVYGSTSQAQISEGRVDTQSFREALLSERLEDGTIQCVDGNARAAGCVPINIFGAGTVTDDALAYISTTTTRNAVVEQNIIQGNVTGAIVDLPAGALQFAAGVEYREEESRVVNDSLTARGLGSGNATPDVIGSFDVFEGYLELDVPLISEGIVHYAGISGAVRVSDYSSVGTTETYEGRFEIAPTSNLRFRASYSQAVRAPNIGELFNPGGETFAQVGDLCNGVTATTAGAVAANCRQDPGIAARIAANGVFELTQAEIQGTGGFVGGNASLIDPNAAPLFEETAETFSVGATYSTSIIDGISTSVTVDYFDIKVDDAISSISRTNVLNLCYNDASFPNNPFCGNITRFGPNHPNAGALDRVNSGVANVASFETSGIDVTYNTTIDASLLGINEGSFTLRGSYTYLIDYTTVPFSGGEPNENHGEIGFAKHKINANIGYRTDNLSIQWQARFISDGRISDQFLSDEDCRDVTCWIDSVMYHDVQVRYNLGDKLGFGQEVEIYGGIENVFDKQAPLIPDGLPGSDTGTKTNAGAYDAIGRAFYIGTKIKF